MKRNNVYSVASALFLVFSLMLAFSGTVAAAPGAVVTLSSDAAYFDAGQPVIVHVTIINPTNHPLKVLKWHTPADDVEGPLFSVQQNGVSVAYIGALYKRPKPAHDDYINLKAGESITRDVDLGMYYDLSVSGNYIISYDTASDELYSEKRNGGKEADRLLSDELKLSIDGRTYSSPAVVEPLAVTGGTSFNKCSPTQQTLLGEARTQASAYSAGAKAYLNTNTFDTRFSTWFGVYDSARYATVNSHFNSISSAMDSANVTFDCSCKKKYYAYVYPANPYVIYLCSVFWTTAPMTGTDSKAGTLIHEMSHFTSVASTKDFVYGQTGAKSLAVTNPGNAVNNADNHEYFAENSPKLP